MDEIQPAMTRKQWRQALAAPPGVIYGFSTEDEGSMDRHRMAAMCLYNTPEGFTRHDATRITHVADTWEMTDELRAYFYGLAKRIAALLPPE